ncbi:hypothetical protein [Lentilactobacillus hilgardii]|jgi:hypothetical protein|uniref:DUF5640 domain-containing protein n=1 Tax=Lentilactobacillus hilgardii TaxID=1588 RepID=A0A6P1E7H5_LENHI|nr:hypothetical protein [Lentilactobacillus hilgardii]EEI71466.1 hypothetical protein HMPREF0496_1285 [Lentilactobacillus hilgardii ATCC 27305]MCT3392066.1 hypothetical protein [Lentilactobacillus hilgardii]QHB51615.1 hypothetical protein GQR93_04970 [Lentilactobacillus hilgardii]RRG12366.1 MAG: hypothetical protein DUD35_01985 [Lactobacillus sp.]
MTLLKSGIITTAIFSFALFSGSTALAKDTALKPIPSTLRGTWKGAYTTTDAGYSFTLTVSKYRLTQNGIKFNMQSDRNSKSSTGFIMSNKPNKKGYWKFTLTVSHDKMYLKRTKKNGKTALIRYSYDTHRKPVVQYLFK